MKKILVLCAGNASRSQMAEGYLRFFTYNKAQISSACLEPSGGNPMAIQVMQDDNIDIAELHSRNIADFSGEHFDYLITVGQETELNKPADILADLHVHYEIPDPEALEMDATQAFTDTREQIKRKMLRFIGTHDDLHRREESIAES